MSIAEASTSNGLGYTGASESPASGQPAKTSRTEDELEIRIEFGGGLHLLFSQQPKHTIHIPKSQPTGSESKPSTMRDLIQWMKGNLLSEREEMFCDGETVRPGILVLVNDADWELEGELDYELKDRDEVVFISTLHGG